MAFSLSSEDMGDKPGAMDWFRVEPGSEAIVLVN
jgi:hypothetical protein